MPITAVDDAVRVAVGVVAERGRFLLTQRAPNAHQGGKWEFPGGKISDDESRFAALQRELREELGIEVREARPLMQLRHAYPDKNVLLDVWSVTNYVGVPRGREGQEARWASRAELLTLDFPEADRPLLRRLWLPGLYAISDCTRYGRSVFLARLERALAGGLRLLQLRETELERDAYVSLAREVVTLCHRYGAKLLLNADPEWVELCGADGVHLNSRRLRQVPTAPRRQDQFVFASCHDRSELERAADIGADAVVLGPVAVTPSHERAPPLGWENFEHLCRAALPAVYALGGMRARDLEQARVCGAHGLSMIRGIWEADDIGAVIAVCETV